MYYFNSFIFNINIIILNNKYMTHFPHIQKIFMSQHFLSVYREKNKIHFNMNLPFHMSCLLCGVCRQRNIRKFYADKIVVYFYKLKYHGIQCIVSCRFKSFLILFTGMFNLCFWIYFLYCKLFLIGCLTTCLVVRAICKFFCELKTVKLFPSLHKANGLYERTRTCFTLRSSAIYVKNFALKHR